MISLHDSGLCFVKSACLVMCCIQKKKEKKKRRRKLRAELGWPWADLQTNSNGFVFFTDGDPDYQCRVKYLQIANKTHITLLRMHEGRGKYCEIMT